MDFSTLSYRDIQKIAKEYKVPANKKREELIKLIQKAMDASNSPVDATPVEATPVEVAPIEVAPVEVAPVEVAPVEVAPVEEDKDFDINNLHSILNTFSDDDLDNEDKAEIAPMMTFEKPKTYKEILSTPQKEVKPNVLKRNKENANKNNENSENFLSPPAKSFKNVLSTPSSTYKMLNSIEKSANKNTAIMNFWLTKGNTPIKKNFDLNDENSQPFLTQNKDKVQKKLNFNCYTPFKKTRNACQANNIKI